MTGIELVRSVIPGLSDEACDALLWDCTAFPFSRDKRKLRRQLRTAWKKGGKTVDGALNYSMRQLDEWMAKR